MAAANKAGEPGEYRGDLVSVIRDPTRVIPRELTNDEKAAKWRFRDGAVIADERFGPETPAQVEATERLLEEGILP